MIHKGDANNILPTAIAYRSVPRYGYCVSCTIPCVLRYTGAQVYYSGPDQYARNVNRINNIKLNKHNWLFLIQDHTITFACKYNSC